MRGTDGANGEDLRHAGAMGGLLYDSVALDAPGTWSRLDGARAPELPDGVAKAGFRLPSAKPRCMNCASACWRFLSPGSSAAPALDSGRMSEDGFLILRELGSRATRAEEMLENYYSVWEGSDAAFHRV